MDTVNRSFKPIDVWYSFFHNRYNGNNYNYKVNETDLKVRKYKMFVYESQFIGMKSGCVNITLDNTSFAHSCCIFSECFNELGGVQYILVA